MGAICLEILDEGQARILPCLALSRRPALAQEVGGARKPSAEQGRDIGEIMPCVRLDVFSLQKLMGHADLQVLRRYLAQTTEGIALAHRIGSSVDNNRL
jgi:hypothetical protein